VTEVKIWDPLVRLFHWSLLSAFAMAYWTQEEDYSLHLTAGYVVLGLVCFRIIWGIIGSRYARVADFIYRPSAVLKFLKGYVSGLSPRYAGHNPAGGYMILALLICLLVITVSGVMLDAAENRAGPLSGYRLFLCTDLIDEVHEWSTSVCLGLISLHILGVMLSSWLCRENLVAAMITGNKKIQTQGNSDSKREAS